MDFWIKSIHFTQTIIDANRLLVEKICYISLISGQNEVFMKLREDDPLVKVLMNAMQANLQIKINID